MLASLRTPIKESICGRPRQIRDKSHRRLSPIGQTRWWSKDEGLKKRKPQYSLLTDAVLTLEVIEEKDNEKAVYVPKHMVLKRASLNSSDFSENF